jgi:coenzyme Q-binding protein COQ10
MRVMISQGCVKRATNTPDTDELPKFTVTRRVAFSPEQIFRVVADVANYKEFLPLVERSTVRNRKPAEEGCERFSADLVVGYHKLRIQEEFASQVETSLPKLLVSTVSTGSAVKKLNSTWQITGVADKASDITFTVDYEMKSPMLQMLLGGMFDSAVRKIMSAFEARARELYST